MLWFEYYWHKVLRRPHTLAKRVDRGKGQTVVFLHGIASTGRNWERSAKMLDETKYRVIVFDLLGFGDSPRPDWLEYSVDDHARAVMASLRRMRIRGKIILVGHSMGSLVAAHMAYQYPKRVKRLVLYQMPVYAKIPSLDVRDFRRQAYLSVFQYLATHPRVTLWYARLLGRTASRVAGFVLDEYSWQPFELSLRNTIMQQQSYQGLRDLQVPTDVVYGRFDIFVIKKNLQHFFRPSKHVRFYEIDDIHRVSERASRLIVELIETPPQERTKLRTKRVRLIDMHSYLKRKTKQKNTAKLRRHYGVAGAIALLVFMGATSLAWPGFTPTLSTWEHELFQSMNSWNGSAFIDAIARIMSDAVWVIAFVVAGLLGIGLLWSQKYARVAWRVALPAITTYVVVYLAEIVIGRERPGDLLGSGGAELRASQDGMGFPSGHAAIVAVVVISLWPMLSNLARIGAILGVVLVGWSRVYLGVHFPLDIVAGIAAGVLVGSLFHAMPWTWRQLLRLEPATKTKEQTAK